VKEFEGEHEELKRLAEHYYTKIISGEIEEATEILKELAKLHYNFYTVQNILDKGN